MITNNLNAYLIFMINIKWEQVNKIYVQNVVLKRLFILHLVVIVIHVNTKILLRTSE